MLTDIRLAYALLLVHIAARVLCGPAEEWTNHSLTQVGVWAHLPVSDNTQRTLRFQSHTQNTDEDVLACCVCHSRFLHACIRGRNDDRTMSCPCISSLKHRFEFHQPRNWPQAN